MAARGIPRRPSPARTRDAPSLAYDFSDSTYWILTGSNYLSEYRKVQQNTVMDIYIVPCGKTFEICHNTKMLLF